MINGRYLIKHIDDGPIQSRECGGICRLLYCRIQRNMCAPIVPSLCTAMLLRFPLDYESQWKIISILALGICFNSKFLDVIFDGAVGSQFSASTPLSPYQRVIERAMGVLAPSVLPRSQRSCGQPQFCMTMIRTLRLPHRFHTGITQK